MEDAAPAEIRTEGRRRSVRAPLQAAILIGLVLDVPVVARLLRRVTRKPRREDLTIEGIAAELFIPGGKGPWPAWIFVTGAHPERRREPVVRRLAEALARTGFIVLVPDLPGLGEGEIDQRTLDSANAAADFMLGRPDVKDGRVALCGASAGASIALLAASRPEVASRISVVAAISPWADLAKMVCLATTSSYPDGGSFAPYPVAALLRRVVARSLVATLEAGPERERLLAEVGDVTLEEGDPLERLLAGGLDDLTPSSLAVVRLLTNTDCETFDDLRAALPEETGALLKVLSPLHVAAAVRAPVELVVPESDPYFPPSEAEALAAALSSVRLTVTSTLDHTRPMLSRVRPRAFGRFAGFVVRGLGAA